MPQIVQLPLIFASQLFWLVVVFGIIYFIIAKGMVPKIQGVSEQARETHVLMNNCYRDFAVNNARQLADLLEE